jgi:hypothetical protein
MIAPWRNQKPVSIFTVLEVSLGQQSAGSGFSACGFPISAARQDRGPAAAKKGIINRTPET